MCPVAPPLCRARGLQHFLRVLSSGMQRTPHTAHLNPSHGHLWYTQHTCGTAQHTCGTHSTRVAQHTCGMRSMLVARAACQGLVHSRLPWLCDPMACSTPGAHLGTLPAQRRAQLHLHTWLWVATARFLPARGMLAHIEEGPGGQARKCNSPAVHARLQGSPCPW